MIEVHHLNNSRSQRILWLLEELGAEYTVVRYERDPATMLAPASLRAVHPLGRSPVLREGDVTVAESGAIVEYLLETHGVGRLRPPVGTEAGRRFTYWLHFAEGSAMTPLLLKLYLSRLGEAGAPLLARVEAQIAAMLDYVEVSLAPGGHLCGPEFSAADVQMSFPLEASAARGGLGPDRPRSWDLLARLQARPAYARAIARGGRYELLR